MMNVPRIFIFSLGQFSSVLQYDDDPMIIEQFRTLKAKCWTDWTDGPYCYGTIKEHQSRAMLIIIIVINSMVMRVK